MLRQHISIVILLQFFTTAHIFTAAFHEENAPLYLSTYFDGLTEKNPDCLAIQDLKLNNLKRLHVNFFFIDWQKQPSAESHRIALALLKIARKEQDPDLRIRETALDLAMNYCLFTGTIILTPKIRKMCRGLGEQLKSDELIIIAGRCAYDTNAHKKASRFFFQNKILCLFENSTIESVKERKERLMIDLIHSEVFRSLFKKPYEIPQMFDLNGFTSWDLIDQDVRVTNPRIVGTYLHKLLSDNQEDIQERIFNEAPGICKTSLKNKIFSLHFLFHALMKTKKDSVASASNYFKKSINVSAYYDRSLFGEFILSLASNNQEFIFPDIKKTSRKWKEQEDGIFHKDMFRFIVAVKLNPKLTNDIITFLSPEDLRDEYKKLLTDSHLDILRNWVEKRYDRLLSEFNEKPDAHVYEFLVFAREISQPTLQQRICAYLNPSTMQPNAI